MSLSWCKWLMWIANLSNSSSKTSRDQCWDLFQCLSNCSLDWWNSFVEFFFSIILRTKINQLLSFKSLLRLFRIENRSRMFQSSRLWRCLLSSWLHNSHRDKNHWKLSLFFLVEYRQYSMSTMRKENHTNDLYINFLFVWKDMCFFRNKIDMII